MGCQLGAAVGRVSGARKVLKSSTSLMVVSTRSTLPCLSYIFTEFLPTRCLIRTPSGRCLTSLTTSASSRGGRLPCGGALRPRKRITSGLRKVVRPLHQFGIQMRQRRPVPKHDVGGPFALIGEPVVLHGNAA